MAETKPLVITQASVALQLYPRPPILTSLQVGWSGFNVAYLCQPPGEVPEVCTPLWHCLGIFTHGDRVIYADRKLDGRRRRDAVVGGDVVITPVNVSQGVAWEAEGDFIILGIEPTFFARAVDDSAPEQIELLPHFATPDPLIYQIGLVLKNVLATGGIGSRLYAETMVNALSVHLRQHYSSRKPILHEYAGGLSKYKLRQVIEYIQAHLDQDLGLTELAALVQMSPHYFSHLFKQSTGITPHQYVISCRVERAKELLLKGGIAIADIATQVGFANQSHLNLHFKRLLGVTPAQIRNF
jgi:AraC family transcriptional regulator